ncbi:MAG: chorismate dehydratase [Planctomycetota bacterium]|jgi:chorismate dehydratase
MPSPPLRVGSVPYLVGRPLDTGLGEEPGIQLSHDVPARLIAKLRAGELDVALVSSIELFRQPGYRYIPDIAVAGRGSVSSVQLFLRKPLSEVKTIALDPSSRTAATLVRVLLADRPAGAPKFFEVPFGEDPRATDCDAWLRIGDPALREYFVPDAPKVFNPSKAWTERTGLPFVFAAWIVRADVAIEGHLAAFARSRLRGARAIGDLANEAAIEWQLPLARCTSYLAEECVYEPGQDMHAALLAFRDAAAKLGLCEANLEPEPIGAFLAHRR